MEASADIKCLLRKERAMLSDSRVYEHSATNGVISEISSSRNHVKSSVQKWIPPGEDNN